MTKLKQYCYYPVLFNDDKPLILFGWEHIYGGMLGNGGWSVPLDLPDGRHRVDGSGYR